MRPWYGFILFFAILSSVLGGVHYYLWRRLGRDLQWGKPYLRVMATLLTLAFTLLLASFPLGRVLPLAVQRPLMFTTFSWLGLMFLLFVAFGARDLAGFIARTARLLPEVDEGRRLFLRRATAGMAGLVAVSAGVKGMREAMGALHVKRVEISGAGVPPGLKGMRIVQISDVHIGPILRREFSVEIVRKVNALQPDLIAVTGDLVDGRVSEIGNLVEPFAALRSRLGVFYIPGNHEYYSGLDEWMAHAGVLNMRSMKNERVTLQYNGADFDLAGLDDETGEPDIDLATNGRNHSLPLIVLAHQPRTVRRVDGHGAFLQLSGHTHGGQIWPFNYLVAIAHPYVNGLYRQGDLQVYVNPGTGFWGPPMRLGTHAEITELVIG